MNVFFFLSSPAPTDVEPARNPCYPSPCGLNSQCAVSADNTPSCSCIPTFIGSPPNCRPECRVNSDCPNNRACIRQQCADPCVGSCGLNALCQVILHQARCTCPESYTGDPFTVCSEIICKKIPRLSLPDVSIIRWTLPRHLVQYTIFHFSYLISGSFCNFCKYCI